MNKRMFRTYNQYKKRNKPKQRSYHMNSSSETPRHAYETNPFYTVIGDTLYFICLGGKHIPVRKALLQDYTAKTPNLKVSTIRGL